MSLMRCCGIVLCLAAIAGQAKILFAQTLHSGIDPDGFDPTVRPQDDLYMNVNGRWMLKTEIPPDKSNYGSFTALIDAAQKNIRVIIEKSAANPTNDDEQKVGDFYSSFMQIERIDQLGLKPLESEIAKIEAISSRDELIRYCGYGQTVGIAGPFGFFVDQDDRDSTRYLAALVQHGTTLPDRDYYLKDEERYEAARTALTQYIAKLFKLANRPDEQAVATAIVSFETRLAEVQWDRTELRDAEKRYNKFSVDGLDEITPGFPWPMFFAAVGTPDVSEVNVLTPSFFTGVVALLDGVPLETWKNYLLFRLFDGAAPLLPQPFVDAHFELHDKVLSGVPEQEPRWKRAVDATSGGRAGDFGVLGDVAGRLYVREYFQPAAKQRMDQLVANLVKAYEISIRDLTWMTDATKERALEKLAKITPKIGYPSNWRDYTNLEIRADDLVGNLVRSNQHEHRRMINKLGKPVDRTEWGMTPQTVNAYYNPSMNEIVFPAAILQPPFFDAEADAAANYGGIGAVIGHEISHGFDDQGSKYDGDGNLQNWWTDEDREAFEALTTALVSQFEGYEALPGKNLNGKLTLGENIADLSGMAIALKAYRLSLSGQPETIIDGHTPAQRFFYGWAQIWRRKYRDAELARRLVTDPHSPSHFRANGPVTNLDAFYEAFDVKPGDELFKPQDQRIRIW